MFNVTTKLKECKKRLKRWSKETFVSVKEQIRVTKEKLWVVEAKSLQSGDQGLVDNLKADLHSLLEKEEKIWHQRSRVQ